MSEVWAMCTPCGRPFAVNRDDLEAYRLCPICLSPANRIAVGATVEIALGLLERIAAIDITGV